MRVGTTKLAAPPEIVALPRLVVPSRKLTLPEGVPEDEDTVAVSVSAV